MNKSSIIDPITAVIIGATLVAIVYLLLQSGVMGQDQKIVVLKTDPLVEMLNEGASGETVMALKQSLEVQAAQLADQGYIVLRSEMVRAAPEEVYVEAIE